MNGFTADLLPTPAPSVRFAGPDDEEGIVAMVRDAHTETGLRDGVNRPLPLSESKVRAIVRRALLGQPGALYGAADDDMAIVGVIGGVGELQACVYLSAEETWYSETAVLIDVLTYVARPYRKSPNAKRLIAFSKAVASVLAMPLVMSVMSTEREAAKMRLFERSLGVKQFGAVYVWNPSPAFPDDGPTGRELPPDAPLHRRYP